MFYNMKQLFVTPAESFGTYLKKLPATRYLIFVSAVSTFAGFMQGYTIADSGVILLDNLFIKEVSHGSNKFLEKFLMLFFSGQVFGAMFSYLFSDSFGRRAVLKVATPLVVCCLVWNAFSFSGASLLTARFFLGAIVGALVPTAAVYASEVSTKDERGRCVSLLHLSTVCGAAACEVGYQTFRNLAGAWRLLSLLPTGLLLLQTGLLTSQSWVPESARWQLAHRTPAECLESMRQLRHTSDALSKDARLGDGWTELLANRSLRQRLCLSVTLLVAQAWVGQSLLTSFAYDTLEAVGLSAASNTGTDSLWSSLPDYALLAVYAVSIIGALLGCARSDFWGRRRALIVGFGLIAVCWLVVAAATHYGVYLWEPLPVSGELTLAAIAHSPAALFLVARRTACLVALLCFALVYSASVGPAAITVCAEQFPMRVRTKAIALGFALHTVSAAGSASLLKTWFRATSSSLVDVTAIPSSGPTLGPSVGRALSGPPVSSFTSEGAILGTPTGPTLDALTRCGLLYAAVALALCLYVYLALPETSGVMLEDIEELFDFYPMSGATTSALPVSDLGGGGTGSNAGSSGAITAIAMSGHRDSHISSHSSSGASVHGSSPCCVPCLGCAGPCCWCCCADNCAPIGFRRLASGTGLDKVLRDPIVCTGSHHESSAHGNPGQASSRGAGRSDGYSHSSGHATTNTHVHVGYSHGEDVTEMMMFEPSSLHKYSGDMRESQFLQWQEDDPLLSAIPTLPQGRDSQGHKNSQIYEGFSVPHHPYHFH